MTTSVPVSWADGLLGGITVVDGVAKLRATEIEVAGDGVASEQLSVGRIRLTFTGGTTTLADPDTNGLMSLGDYTKLSRLLALTSPSVSWNPLPAFQVPTKMTHSSETPVPIFLGVDPTSLLEVELVAVIEAGSGSNLQVAEAYGPLLARANGLYPAHWEDWDEDLPYVIAVQYIAGGFRSLAWVHRLRPTATPVVSGVTVDMGTPTHVVVATDIPVCDFARTGVTLSGTFAGATPTVTGALGQNTDSLTYTVSPAIVETDVFSLVFAGNRSCRSLNGQRVAAGSHSVTVTGLFDPATDIPNATLWLEGEAADVGSPGEGGQVASWTSRIGSIVFAQGTAGARPTWSATAVAGHLPGVSADGIDDEMTTAATLTTMFVTGSDWYLAGIAQVDAIDTTALGYNTTDGILTETAGYFGVLARSLTPNGELAVYVYDGSTDYAESYESAVAAGDFVMPASFSFQMRHDGTNVRVYIDGTLVHTEAIGAIADLSGALRLFRSYGGQRADMRLNHLFAASSNPSDGVAAAHAAWMADRLTP